MSKEYRFSLGRALTRYINRSITNQLDLIKICLETSREILTEYSDTNEVGVHDEEGFRIVYPNSSGRKMQRMFFYNVYEKVNDQPMFTIQSFAFPFKLEKIGENEFKIWCDFSNIGRFEFNSAIISQIVTIINIIDNKDLTWGDTWVEELLDLLHGENRSLDTDLLFYIINELLIFDFGYLRFDNDPKHQGDNHPIYHIDSHLDNRATYKLGLHSALDISKFLNLLDNTTDVGYIS